MTCRIAPKNPLAMEKFDTIPQMGRFTLRDEGQTIAVGRIQKYKPFVKGIVGASSSNSSAAKNANSSGPVIVNNNTTEELVYDMETGEMRPKAKQLAGIAEGDENEDDNWTARDFKSKK